MESVSSNGADWRARFTAVLLTHGRRVHLCCCLLQLQAPAAGPTPTLRQPLQHPLLQRALLLLPQHASPLRLLSRQVGPLPLTHEAHCWRRRPLLHQPLERLS